jgi:hypothetical protein
MVTPAVGNIIKTRSRTMTRGVFLLISIPHPHRRVAVQQLI